MFQHGKRAPGAALVIVISMISLLILLAIALLVGAGFARQRTALETATTRSELMAQGAFQTVLADILDEMDRGASTTSTHTLADGTTLRFHDLADRRGAARPGTSLQDPTLADTTLVKQSTPGHPFHAHDPAPAPRASSVSTSSSAHPLSSAFWESPRLLPPGRNFSQSTTPTWIYLTRGGTNPTTFRKAHAARRSASGPANDEFVMGRYAYNLYDLSGALDLNAAGYPLTGGPEAGLAATKGSLAFADLTQLPGMSDDIADALATWKHDWGTGDEEYIRRAETAGWLGLVANDNLFLSRQDLLRFADRNPGALPPEALPYLTHFSRDLDAPTFRPHRDRPKVELPASEGGNDAKGVEDELNRPVTAFHPGRERFLLDRRFPLERLKWVSSPGTNGPADQARAERYFGLRWNGTIWEYVHARDNGDLYTLQDVPADREPNFFEILRASINVGSLGRQYAARGFDPHGPSQDLEEWSHRLPTAAGKGGLDGSVNRHILEIGACIIDQYDTDSYPSAIRVRGAPANQIVYGKEDVPYLARTFVAPYRGQKIAAPVYNQNGEIAHHDSYEVNMTLQVGLWRPHQPVPAEDYAGPSRFRIRPVHVDPFGGSLFWLMSGWTVPNAAGSPPNGVDPNSAGDYSYWGGPNYRLTHPELFPKTFTGDEFIEISFDHSSYAFREPQTVHSPAHAAKAGYDVSGPTVPIKTGDLEWFGTPSTDLISGFLVGKGMTARWEPTANQDRLFRGWFTGKPIEFILECEDPAGRWRPYQQVESTYQSTWSHHYVVEPYWDTASWVWTSLMIDPRTNRFGGIGGTGQCWTQRNNPSGAPQTGPNMFAPRLHWPEGAALRWETNKTASFEGRETYSGVWSWWRTPAPDTGWSYNGSVDWWMNFQHAGCLENNLDAWNNEFTLACRDPDGVLRPGVGADIDYSGSGGMTGNPMSRRHRILSSGRLRGSETLTGRPRILNRAFRSVGELACSFRGTPWKDIDFLDPSSADAALLDVFRLHEYPDPDKLAEPPLVAGRVNLNAASQEVLKALFAGALIDDQTGSIGPAALKTFTDAQAAELAREFHDWVHSEEATKGPLLSLADLVQAYHPALTRDRTVRAPGLARTLSELLTESDDRSINDRREAAVRALSGGTTVRTWTFMLDLVVQSGELRANGDSLADFNPAAEQRYWIHFSVDRFTGKLLDAQWERVANPTP